MRNRSIATAILLSSMSSNAPAATVSEYVTACVNNQANRMGPELCECVGQRARRKHGQDGLDYLYYGVTKQGAEMQQVLAGLGPQQKVGIMMFSMQAPADCARELAKLEEMRRSQGPATRAGGSAESAAEATDRTR